ncbi:MAG: asparagine synthase (glutamine-hydrolyzing) [Aeromicrobium sp.]|nr:asparagine synthase (glutamine-hydrolyzing) [Burkholderiales bacterium]
MCGIAGIYAFSASARPVDRTCLRAIRDHMAVRGPDGQGEWFSADGRVGFGHRRLAIIDLSEGGAQPMQSADGQLVITFNGEIYNYRELRRELESQGHVFRSDSDTEVLLHLYQEKGTAMLQSLRGMYAFALWDSRKQALLLARDPFGIKPLYYTPAGSNNGTLRFASQVKALLAGGQIDTAPEPAGHVGFYIWGSVPAPYTLYRGIRAIPAGHFLWVHGRSALAAQEPQPFCLITDILADAANNPARGSEGDALEAIGAAVRDSVAAHHVADVPVGMFLSSGIDSAIITALSSAHGKRPHTLTLAFAEYAGTANDESPLAEQLAAQLGTRHTTVMVSKAEFKEQRKRLLDAMDQPSIDGVNSWFVSQAAASQGIKVALSGLGGDELFASYPSFADLPRIRNLARPFARLSGLGKTLRHLSLPVLSRFTSPKYAGLLEYGGTLGGAYLLRRSLYMPWELNQLLDLDLVRDGSHELQSRLHLNATTAGIPQDRMAISALEMSWYMRHQLLVDSDWASMAHSLELRVPFLDVPLLRAAAPWLAAHPGLTKPQVAKALAHQLPNSVLYKRKTGFSVPVRDWLLGDRPDVKDRGLRGWASMVHGSVFAQTSAPAGSPHRCARGHDSSHTPRDGNLQQTPRAAFSLWSPEMATRGGVQSYMWRLWETFSAVTEADGRRITGLSLMDEPRLLAAWANPVQYRPVALSGRKRFFARLALSTSHAAECVVVGHLHLAPLAWLSWRLGRIGRYVVVLHGIEAWKRAGLFERLALRQADAVVATTHYTARTCAVVNGLPEQNFKVIPLCLEPLPATPAPNFKLDGAFPILFVGRLSATERYKGLETLMHAVARLNEENIGGKLHVIGDGDDAARLQTIARSLGLSDDTICFHGTVSDAVLQAAYASAKVFAMPSAKEGFGIVFLEAMRHDVVCIGGAHGGMSEVFTDGVEGYLVPFGDIDLLTRRLITLGGDDATRHRLAQAGRRRFQSGYEFDVFAARWRSLLNSDRQ